METVGGFRYLENIIIFPNTSGESRCRSVQSVFDLNTHYAYKICPKKLAQAALHGRFSPPNVIGNLNNERI